MKLMHTDQEMSIRVDLKRSPPPNVVAKLMGLDSLPSEEHDSVVRSDHTRSRSEIPLSYWEEQDNRLFHCVGLDRYRDAYNMSKQPLKFGYNESPIEMTDDERMVIVRQKFLEVRSRSTDEKFCHSKQFQDALQASTSVIPHPRKTERITFLNTSKMSNSVSFARSGNNESGKYDNVDRDYVNYTQPARIVVLKSKRYTVSSLYSSQLDSPRMISAGFIGDVEDDESRELRGSVKSITIQMCRRLSRHLKDETLNSSLFSNGRVRDESSFGKSETENPFCNLGESEADMSPLSRHSWDCLSRSGIPYSPSGFSRASSYAGESAVSREAKKRLSERWALMASDANSRHFRRNSSTLGELLSLSEVKKKVTKAERKCQEHKDSNLASYNERRADEDANSSLTNHKRSKSLPTSSALFGTKPNMDHLVPGSKRRARREDTETRSVRLSLKEKFASFFFSKNKKTSNVKSLRSDTKDELQRASADFDIERNRIIYNKVPRHSSHGLHESSCMGSLATVIGKQDLEFLEVVPTPTKPSTSGNPGENQDQPSPISVLDTHFDEDEFLTAKLLPHREQFDRHGFQSPRDPISSKLLDKSPLIARTLSWDHLCTDTDSPYPDKESEGDKHEWILFLKTLISSVVLPGDMQRNTFFVRWHSPESPLNPSLRDKDIIFKDKETQHEAKRQKRLNQKLVFDYVNALLLDIGHEPGLLQVMIPLIEAKKRNLFENVSSSTILDEATLQINAWFCGEVRCASDNSADDNTLVVEQVVTEEVLGKGWTDKLSLEVGNLGKEIEGKLLDELVCEALFELTGRVECGYFNIQT